jgi:hypothetical protein
LLLNNPNNWSGVRVSANAVTGETNMNNSRTEDSKQSLFDKAVQEEKEANEKLIRLAKHWEAQNPTSPNNPQGNLRCF